jgi:hypothetical protein
VLRRLAFEHRPSVAPPLFLPGTNVEVPGVAAPTAVLSRGLVLGLWLELTSLTIDNDQMESRSLKQTNEVGDAR